MRTLLLFALVLYACGSSGTTSPATDATSATDATDASVDRGAPSDLAPTSDVTAPVDAPVTGGDSGPLLPPRDAGYPFGDAGALGPPEWAVIVVNTRGECPAFTACGGSELGTWDVSGGCIDLPLETQLAMCPGARVTRSQGRGRGRVTFAGGFAHRVAQWEAEVEVFIPALCASFVGGCAGIEGAIRGVAPEAACRTEGPGDCRCAARQAGALNEADGYSIMGQQIVSTTLNKHWDYCVEGMRLRYRDVSPSGPREPGTIELTRRSP